MQIKTPKEKEKANEKGTEKTPKDEKEVNDAQAEGEKMTITGEKTDSESETATGGEKTPGETAEELIKAAEERGYRRGLEEGAAAARQKAAEANAAEAETTVTSTPTFLGHIRPGFWD